MGRRICEGRSSIGPRQVSCSTQGIVLIGRVRDRHEHSEETSESGKSTRKSPFNSRWKPIRRCSIFSDSIAGGGSTGRIEQLLAEILKWTKFAGAEKVKAILIMTLDSKQKLQIYNLSDGEKGAAEIGGLVGTSDRTVRRCWEAWSRLGIMEPINVRGGDRFRRTFDLGDFGLEAPPATITAPTQPTAQKTTTLEST